MTRRIVQSPLAKYDMVEQALYSDRDNPAAADRFLLALDRTLAALADIPGMGASRNYGRIEGLRMWRVRGFEKHLIFYRPIDGGIEVIRLLHSARDIAAALEETED